MICTAANYFRRIAPLRGIAARLRAYVMLLAFVIAVVLPSCLAQADAVSAPAILQIFEAKWDTITDRQVDLFYAGYGSMWLPPPSRADSGPFSVGYDVFDRFDLGSPRNETLYGTEQGLKTLTANARQAGVSVYVDFILNHNGFGDMRDPNFVQLGGYPGFALTLPNDQFGDFHDPEIDFGSNPLQGRLSGLIDIAQDKNHQFIRHPVDPNNPNNIPAGTVFNQSNPTNARFYPDQSLGGLTVFDPKLNQSVTLYDFNLANPMAGDPVMENALGLMLRNARWMVQEVGVDGFRLDAVKHFPHWVLDYWDQAVYRANPRLNHDGSIQPVFSFSEILDGNRAFVQSFIRQDLPNPLAIDPSDTTVGGNRDALDFPLFFALRNNLTGNGFANNWHHIRNASQDLEDDGLRNGSAGVSFVDSHDELPGGFPFLKNVAYAYTLMRPGNALVYFNAKEFGDGRSFPNDGKVDALGGFYGDTITTLVGIRNSHGRGDFHERWVDDAFNPNGFSNIYIYERSNSAIVGLNSRNDAFVETRNGVQTNFAPGTILVELTGNAADPTVDPGGVIPETIRVNSSGQVNVSIPSNDNHGRGYVIYGLATPEGELSISNVVTTLGGATPTAANNGTARLGDIDVIRDDTFTVRLDTTPVSLINPDNPATMVRDFQADGDAALIKFNNGMDLNNISGIDHTTPGSIVYGFEEFTDTRIPGYINDGGTNVGTGFGTYEQVIDTTGLAEGRHFITVRAFRHRDDGGPPVFTDFKRVIYVDRLPPEAEVVSFEPFASNPSQLQNRDLIVRSTDQTADNMHIFLDLPAGLSDAQVLSMALGGQNDAGSYDVDSWVYGFTGVRTGNHVATVVTFEPTFDGTHGFNVQRFPGLFTETGLGAGFGDMNGSGTVTSANLAGIGNNSFEDVLYSQNAKFNAAADVTGDGLVTNLDLFALGQELINGGASQAALDTYLEVLLRRGDMTGDGLVGVDDVQHLYDNFGETTWLEDLNGDGMVDIADVATLITDIVQTVPGDFNLDGVVDGQDFLIWQRNVGNPNAMYHLGDANMDGVIDAADLVIWQSNFGFQASPLLQANLASEQVAVPEPGSLGMLCLGLMWFIRRRITFTNNRGRCAVDSRQ